MENLETKFKHNHRLPSYVFQFVIYHCVCLFLSLERIQVVFAGCRVQITAWKLYCESKKSLLANICLEMLDF